MDSEVMLIDAVWIGMIACAVTIAYFPSYLSTIASHGKFSISSSFNHHHESSSHPLLQWLEKTQLQLLQWFVGVQVPKSYFTHFYITGMIVSLCLLASNDKSDVSMPLCLFLLHVSRRLYECLSITIYGDSKIHLAGYVVGILHYVLVPISIDHINVNYNKPANALTLASSIIVFIIANILQFRFHYILFLAKIKMKSNHHSISGTSGKDKHKYPLPEGIGFDSVCCPHYTAEIIIYLSLWVMDMHNFTAVLVFLWVVANLSVVANLQFQWYKQQYGHELMVKRKQWKRLIPGGW